MTANTYDAVVIGAGRAPLVRAFDGNDAVATGCVNESASFEYDR